MKNPRILSHLLTVAIMALSIAFASTTVIAQTVDFKQVEAEAEKLFEAGRFLDSLPLYEKLSVAYPENATFAFRYAVGLMNKSVAVTIPAEKILYRKKARAAFVNAKKLGFESELMETFIETIPIDGALSDDKFSWNMEAEEAMNQAESAFASGKMDEALALYQKALKLDPTVYYAALFSGDVYKQKGDFANAEIWYQKAIAIDPFIETAYRYSATPLMNQKKYDEARKRYVEAFIISPYSRLAPSGLIQWGEVTKTKLAHPNFEIPVTVGKNNEFQLDASILLGDPDTGAGWLIYLGMRTTYKDETFAKDHPNETVYRHSLQEEAYALRGLIDYFTKGKKKPKKTPDEIKTLINIEKDGFLEAFILLALPDQGIARDHDAYMREHKSSLIGYVEKYVIRK
ncbi:MAG: tetratricopeptide repeat protein [Pyrinomonadaceae bacterium]